MLAMPALRSWTRLVIASHVIFSNIIIKTSNGDFSTDEKEILAQLWSLGTVYREGGLPKQAG